MAQATITIKMRTLEEIGTSRDFFEVVETSDEGYFKVGDTLSDDDVSAISSQVEVKEL